ncbi:MAG: hypothetical protein HFH51_03605 [Lachnospiraceae bacterium]|nr:hypothetical protein [Lachnospiraceae bacterium]
MDYKQEMFYRMPDQNRNKMPFYMAYPMQNVYLEELEYERDMQKLKDLYPKEVKSIQALVEEECDKMEYEGSLMFDEYPDKLMLRQIVNRIYDGAAGGQMNMQSVQGFEASPYEAEQYEPQQYKPEQYAAGYYQENEEKQAESAMEEDMLNAEEIPLAGNLVEQRRPPGPGWGPPPKPGWGPPPPPPGPGWGPPPPPPGRPPHGNGLQNLIEVLLFNEMYRRRCRHKRCRRWW